MQTARIVSTTPKRFSYTNSEIRLMVVPCYTQVTDIMLAQSLASSIFSKFPVEFISIWVKEDVAFRLLC
jgi:hypothetical protein